MKRKLSLLCGAAVLGVAGSLALTTAGFAQTTTYDKDPGRYYDTNPTPQEQAQTNTLNTTQAQNDGTVQSTTTTTTTTAPETGTAADAQYQAQQQQYQQQQQQYQDQKDRYHAQLMHYEYDRTHPRDWWSASYDRATLDGFYHVERADLIGREVDERDGLMLGEVRDIERAPDGRVARVEIALHDNRSTWIHADNLRYDAVNHTFFTDVPADTLYDHSHETGS